MLVRYGIYSYNFMIEGNIVTLITKQSKKATKGFNFNGTYYWKQIEIDELDFDCFYCLDYWVKYIDDTENNEIWNVNKESIGYLKRNLAKDELIIWVNHDRLSTNWSQHKRGFAERKIDMKECDELIIEQQVFYYNGSDFEPIYVNKYNPDVNGFKASMVLNRSEQI